MSSTRHPKPGGGGLASDREASSDALPLPAMGSSRALRVALGSAQIAARAAGAGRAVTTATDRGHSAKWAGRSLETVTHDWPPNGHDAAIRERIEREGLPPSPSAPRPPPTPPVSAPATVDQTSSSVAHGCGAACLTHTRTGWLDAHSTRASRFCHKEPELPRKEAAEDVGFAGRRSAREREDRRSGYTAGRRRSFEVSSGGDVGRGAKLGARSPSSWGSNANAGMPSDPSQSSDCEMAGAAVATPVRTTSGRLTRAASDRPRSEQRRRGGDTIARWFSFFLARILVVTSQVLSSRGPQLTRSTSS